MEDSGLEQMTEEELQFAIDGGDDAADLPSKDVFAEDAIYDRTDTNGNTNVVSADMENYVEGGIIRTLDGDVAGDEFAQDAMNYQILLGKIDHLLDNLKLDA